MPNDRTAILLIGFQNDYFADDGILHAVIEAGARANGVMENTLALIESHAEDSVPVINLPILFSPDYHELENPTGLMAKIREVGAFRRDTDGGSVSPEITALGDRVEHLIGKTGFNAFNGTKLHDRLQELGVGHVILCGVVTSICIDSTGRAATDLGYKVTVLSDCTSGRSETEHEFYCADVFPLYANVTSSEGLSRVDDA